MNILGVGAWELVAVLLIMLVFAGPKRMIHWSYVLGQHVAKFRKIWSETVDIVQKEFDDAGVGIKLPKEPPTRKTLNRSVTEAVKPLTNPLQESLEDVNKDLKAVKDVGAELNDKKPIAPPTRNTAQANPKPAQNASKATPVKRPAAAKPAAIPEAMKMGTWSGEAGNAPSNVNGNGLDLGTWSKSSDEI